MALTVATSINTGTGNRPWRGSGRTVMLMATVMVIAALSSCALTLPRTRVILKPTALEALPEPRPWLFLKVMPQGNLDYMVELKTPDGKGAYMIVNKAITGAYVNALNAFFHLSVRTSKGADQYAMVDLDAMKLTNRIEGLEQAGNGRQRAHLVLRLEHKVTLYDNSWYEFESIPVDLTVESDVSYSDSQEFTERAGELMTELLVKLEQKLFAALVENDAQGKYIYHFEKR